MDEKESVFFEGGGRTFENPDSGRVIVDSPRRSQGRGDDGGRGNEIVGESVVEVALVHV